MLIPSHDHAGRQQAPSLSRRVNANSQRDAGAVVAEAKLIKKGEC